MILPDRVERKVVKPHATADLEEETALIQHLNDGNTTSSSAPKVSTSLHFLLEREIQTHVILDANILLDQFCFGSLMAFLDVWVYYSGSLRLLPSMGVGTE